MYPTNKVSFTVDLWFVVAQLSDVNRPRPRGSEPSREESNAALDVLRRAAKDSSLCLEAETALEPFGFTSSGKNLPASSKL